MKNYKTCISGIIAAAFLSAPHAYADKSDDTVVITFAREITNLDYNHGTRTEFIILGELIDESLVYVDPETLEYVPNLASSFDVVDETTVDFTLRQGVTFHDGSPFTVEDVLYTFNYIVEDEDNFRHAKVSDWFASIEKTGPHSVRFKLKYAYANFFNDLYRVRIRKNGIMGLPGDYDSTAQATSLTGLGHYQVVSFDPGVEVVLKRFDAHFDGPKSKPDIENMVVRSIPDIGTQQAELMSGGVHWMYNVKKDIGEGMARSGRADYLLGPSLRTGFLVLDAGGFSGEDNPLTKVEVRRAMNHAINRQAIVDNLVGGPAQVIHTACNPVVFGCFQDVTKYEYDPEKAKALLTEAGYPNGFDLELWAYRDKEIAQAITADLGKAGINTSLRYGKLAALNKARAAREIRAYFGTWGSSASPDTATIANIHWRSSDAGDRNLSGDPHITELMLGAEQTLDREKREALYQEGLSLIADQAYWVPLHTYSEGVLTSTDLIFEPDHDGFPRLWELKWR